MEYNFLVLDDKLGKPKNENFTDEKKRKHLLHSLSQKLPVQDLEYMKKDEQLF